LRFRESGPHGLALPRTIKYDAAGNITGAGKPLRKPARARYLGGFEFLDSDDCRNFRFA